MKAVKAGITLPGRNGNGTLEHISTVALCQMDVFLKKCISIRVSSKRLVPRSHFIQDAADVIGFFVVCFPKKFQGNVDVAHFHPFNLFVFQGGFQPGVNHRFAFQIHQFVGRDAG